jgi:ADP-ribose pyrophosphatase
MLEPARENPWRMVESNTIFQTGNLRVQRDQVIGPDGEPTTYTYIRPGQVVGIAALDDAGQIVLVRQWRYPWGHGSWEIPAGRANGDEEPLLAAQRELAEEALVSAEHWRSLGSFYASASFAGPPFALFLARGLSPSVGHQRDAEEADMIVQRVPLAEAVAAVQAGEIQHALSALAIMLVAQNA